MPKKNDGAFDLLRKADMFQTSIPLTFNGKKKFPTPYGGIVSILVYLILSSYFFYQVYLTIFPQYT